MRKRISLFAVVIVVIGLSSSVSLALDLMGPPTAGLKARQSNAGVGYSHSKMDIKLTEGKVTAESDAGTLSGKVPSIHIKNFKTNRTYANLRYGTADYTEVFLRLGGANAKFTDNVDNFDGNVGFAIGLGAKATFYEEGNLKLGTLVQMNWAWSDFDKLSGSGTLTEPDGTPHSYVGTFKSEVQFYDLQIAVGPTYQLADGISIYGGPFFHFASGDFDYKADGTIDDIPGTLEGTWDIDERSIFGGYIGAQVDVAENISCNVEYQHTPTASAIAANLAWTF